MKIKVRPEDFVVEELINEPIIKSGPYTVLKLKKRYWNTLDVIDYVARRLRVSKRLFSRAGLKDRYSLSTQYLSFKGNMKHTIREKNFTVTPIGSAKKPITPLCLAGNRFSITLRNLKTKEIENIFENHNQIKAFGIPNYFDEQRFGSARHRKGFFAKELMVKDYRGALRLLLCYSYKEDSRAVKCFKQCCHQHWGKWKECLPLAVKHYRGIVRHLVAHPHDYRGAIKQIDKELLNLYLLAYQSYLFNQTLSFFVEQYGDEITEVPYSIGTFVFYRSLQEFQTLRNLKIPMINDKTSLNSITGAAIKSVLAKEGVTQKDFALRKMRFRGVRFKHFLRPAIIIPKNFLLEKPQPDEIYKNSEKLKLRLTLPAGSYATMLIKRLMI
ncbi:MAG: tRNA pseudouridine(13) synthase TruD [candidate division WOR-3 bacterium]|nr:MAG: tRNA pseudouridine(13) synthase TruD [candidate division WOR-3 bacterium]